MTDRVVRAVITGSSAGAIKAAQEAAAAYDAAGKTIGDKIDGASTRAASGFSKIGQSIQNLTGIPVGGIFDKMSSKMGETSTKGQGLMKTLSGIGGGVALAGAAGLGAVAAASVDLGAKFQSSMELIHTQAGASQQEVNKMSAAVLNLAGPTATAPEELAAGLFHLESAGMRGQQALDALKVAAEGAKVGHANLEDVTNALNASIASGIPGVQNLKGAMGSLNAIVGAGDMRMQDLAQALGTGVLAAVKGFGLNLNDVGAALATFGDNNIRGADAATALRQTVMAFAKPAATATKALGDIGMTTDQLGKDMQTGGLNKAITDLHKHLVDSGNDGVKAGALLTNAFGKKAGVGIQVLEDQFGRFQSKTQEVAKGSGHFGEAWNATTQTLSFQMQQAKATVEALGTKFGMYLIPKLESLMKVGERVIAWLQKHKTVAEVLAGVIGGILAVVIAAFIIQLGVMAVEAVIAAAPIMAIIAAIALVAFGVFEIVKHWGAIAGFFTKIWHDVEKIFFEVIHKIVAIFEGWYPLILGVLSGGVLLLPLLIVKYWSQIESGVMGIIDAVVGFFVRLPGRIVGALGDVVSTIWGALTASAGWIESNVLAPVVSFFTGLPGRAKQALGDIVSTIWAGLLTSAVWIYQNVELPVINFFRQLPGQAMQALGDITGTIFSGLLAAGSWIDKNVIQPIISVFTGLPGKIGNVIGDFASIGKSILNSVIGGVDAGIDWVNNHIPSVLGVKIFPSLPDIPKLAAGGIVHAQPGGVLALLGEGGHDEAVTPLSGPYAPKPASSGGDRSITVNGYNLTDPHETAAQIGWLLR